MYFNSIFVAELKPGLMKYINFLLLSTLMLFAFSCSNDDASSDDDKDCGKESFALCYAHNWTEFSGLNRLVQGDAIYSHEYYNKDNFSSFIYKVTLKNVCLKSTLEIDLSSIVKFGTPISYIGDFYINGDRTAITMNNINGIISGHSTKALSGVSFDSVEIYNTIVLPNNHGNLALDSTWYNENISSHGIEVKFRNPK